MAQVLLPPGFQGSQPRLKGLDPFVLLPRHGQQMKDPLLDNKRRLVPGGGIQRQSFGYWEGCHHGDAPRDVQPMVLGVGNAALIARNLPNFQQKLDDQPRGVILHFYSLKAYEIISISGICVAASRASS